LTEVLATATLIAGLGGSTAFVNIKDKAQQEVCLQHLKTIGQALAMLDLQSQPLPKACFYPKSPTAADSLAKLMEGKIQAQAFLCPCAPLKLREYKVTYVYNSSLSGKMMSQVPNASDTWVLTDLCVVDPKLPPTHSDGANVLYADGQARWVAARKLPKLK